MKTEIRAPWMTAANHQAIVDGRKRQTRRVMKPQPEFCRMSGSDVPEFVWFPKGIEHPPLCKRDALKLAPYGPIGVTWALSERLHKSDARYAVYADGTPVIDRRTQGQHKWQWSRDWLSPMHFPLYAARDFVTVTGIRVERLQDISEADAIAEGIRRFVYGAQYGPDHESVGYGAEELALGAMATSAAGGFRRLWDSINAKTHPWESNPWVWVYEFDNYVRAPGREMPA